MAQEFDVNVNGPMTALLEGIHGNTTDETVVFHGEDDDLFILFTAGQSPRGLHITCRVVDNFEGYSLDQYPYTCSYIVGVPDPLRAAREVRGFLSECGPFRMVVVPGYGVFLSDSCADPNNVDGINRALDSAYRVNVVDVPLVEEHAEPEYNNIDNVQPQEVEDDDDSQSQEVKNDDEIDPWGPIENDHWVDHEEPEIHPNSEALKAAFFEMSCLHDCPYLSERYNCRGCTAAWEACRCTPDWCERYSDRHCSVCGVADGDGHRDGCFYEEVVAYEESHCPECWQHVDNDGHADGCWMEGNGHNHDDDENEDEEEHLHEEEAPVPDDVIEVEEVRDALTEHVDDIPFDVRMIEVPGVDVEVPLVLGSLFSPGGTDQGGNIGVGIIIFKRGNRLVTRSVVEVRDSDATADEAPWVGRAIQLSASLVFDNGEVYTLLPEVTRCMGEDPVSAFELHLETIVEHWTNEEGADPAEFIAGCTSWNTALLADSFLPHHWSTGISARTCSGVCVDCRHIGDECDCEHDGAIVPVGNGNALADPCQ